MRASEAQLYEEIYDLEIVPTLDILDSRNVGVINKSVSKITTLGSSGFCQLNQ